MKPQKEDQNHNAMAKMVIISLVALVLISLPNSNAAAQNVPKCDQYCGSGIQGGMDCAGCCRQAYGNKFATGSCEWRAQPKKCLCDMPISRRPSFSRSAKRGLNAQQRETRSTKGASVPKWLGGKNKPEPLCLRELNAIRHTSSAGQLLKYNSGLEAAARFTANWVARLDCFNQDCGMPKPARRVGILTRYKFKDFADTILAGTVEEKENCNKFITELLKEKDFKEHLLNRLHTEVGCVFLRCPKCKTWKLNFVCFYGKR